jgi:hypothetical protein
VQLFVFRLQSYPRRKHRPGDAFQGGLARHQLPNALTLVGRYQGSEGSHTMPLGVLTAPF